MHLKACSPHGYQCQLHRSNARGTTIEVRKEDPNLEGQILKCTLIIGNFSCYLMANKFNATHGKDSLTTGSCVMVPGLGLHRLPNRQPLSQLHILLEEGFVAIVVMGPQPSGFAYCSVKEHPLSTIWIPSIIVTDSHRLNTVLFHFN